MTESDACIPIVERLDQIYDSSVLFFQRNRYSSLIQAYHDKFGKRPDWLVRSPGRVNLIGEHIDYAGYSVLPMAIDRDVVIAVSTRPIQDTFKIDVCNMNDSVYPSRSFETASEQPIQIDSTINEWSNYFRCGCKGALKDIDPISRRSIQALVSGTIPAGAGLSSSSAFVCASTIATLVSHDILKSKGEIIHMAIQGEHYAGVQTGGMDQSISIMGVQGSVLLIHFYPTLSAIPITFPTLFETPVFVIANTLVTADKHASAHRNYNLRVVETRLVAALLAKKLGVFDAHQLFTLRHLQNLYFSKCTVAHADTAQLKILMGLVSEHIKSEPYTLNEVAQLLGVDENNARKTYVDNISIHEADGFKLYQRAMHVFSEARRVLLFRDTCASVDGNSDSFLQELGCLMNQSQDSCRDLYDCSCSEIDQLTKICRNAGAFGSRLTGAGWGGCTVSLIKEGDTKAFIEKVKQEYYFTKWPMWKSDPDALAKIDDYIFASKPGCGAALFSGTL
ncbi:galactokinase [Batrachochytrium dendrobatidis JEL423]|uniref:Galactokinase n=1 Tax=Batrachochytrium dendrobatidis (strain JEL423) TaxID=403673 RepID=A0A177WSR0_BATDL|nr:galactokinase [Batrachochytrium dendrobatidis JEL423]